MVRMLACAILLAVTSGLSGGHWPLQLGAGPAPRVCARPEVSSWALGGDAWCSCWVLAAAVGCCVPCHSCQCWGLGGSLGSRSGSGAVPSRADVCPVPSRADVCPVPGRDCSWHSLCPVPNGICALCPAQSVPHGRVAAPPPWSQVLLLAALLVSPQPELSTFAPWPAVFVPVPSASAVCKVSELELCPLLQIKLLPFRSVAKDCSCCSVPFAEPGLCLLAALLLTSPRLFTVCFFL